MVVAVDDSSSTAKSSCGELALEALSLLCDTEKAVDQSASSSLPPPVLSAYVRLLRYLFRALAPAKFDAL